MPHNNEEEDDDDDDDESSAFIPKSPSSNIEMKSMDDMDAQIINDINKEYVGNDMSMSTGNILEDCDNLMRIYRNLSENDKERELVFKEFWNKYELIEAKQPHLLLQIPTRVRGFLAIMSDGMEPYKQDRIMMHVLSRNGLLEEPDYITNRYLF